MIRVVAEATAVRTNEGFGSGWRVVARKEFADHLLSGRFLVLIGVLAVAAAGAVFAASGGIRSVAVDAAGVPALFLKLFTVTTDPLMHVTFERDGAGKIVAVSQAAPYGPPQRQRRD